MAEQLAVAHAERDAARERAAANERQRITRELHDTVGHSLSVIAVRAEAADRVAPKNPEAAVDAVAAIAATARTSLSDVRRVLAVLREEAEAELAPVPSLALVPSLVASFADAGLDVVIDGDVPVDERVGASVGAGAYRIVQEALTNVLKHAGPNATAAVRLRVDDAMLTVEIKDTGRGATAEPGGSDGLGH